MFSFKEKVDPEKIRIIRVNESGRFIFFSLFMNDEYFLGIYDIINDKIKLSKSQEIINDIDGGLNFLPFSMETHWCDNQYIYCFLQPTDLIEDLNQGTYTNKSAIDKKAKENFIEMVRRLDINDNPIIMRVKVK